MTKSQEEDVEKDLGERRPEKIGDPLLEDPEEAVEIFGRAFLGERRQLLYLIGREVEERGVLACLSHQEVPKIFQKIERKPFHVDAGGEGRLRVLKDPRGVCLKDRTDEAEDEPLRRDPDHLLDGGPGDFTARKRDDLVEKAQRIAEPPLGLARDLKERLVGRFD